jgi:hypothetical protein
MSPRGARRLTMAFFLAYTIALTYPGVLPFNRARPFVLGVPFTLFWVALWVVLAFGVFLALHGTRGRADRQAPAGRRGA